MNFDKYKVLGLIYQKKAAGDGRTMAQLRGVVEKDLTGLFPDIQPKASDIVGSIQDGSKRFDIMGNGAKREVV